ncbi:MAG TPA: DUF3618 domain-containing protein, partial [Gemmatimonadaceae bacterium]
MAETTADVRRDIELTRERMSDTIAQLEQKLNVMQMVREHPWPAVAVAAGLGVLLAGSKADVKAAAATVKATGGASDKLGGLLDDAASRLITGVSAALSTRVDEWVDELKDAIGSPGSISRERRLEAGAALPSARESAAGNGSLARSGTDGPALGER